MRTMQPIERILVPVDFSDAARGAVRYAAGLAGRFGAGLVLLHVLPRPRYEFAMAAPPPRLGGMLENARSDDARRALEAFPEPPHVEAVRKLGEGDPAEEILQEAESDGHGLIVMPTAGRGPLQRWLAIGSVTVSVLHGARCPVLAGIDFAHRRETAAVTQVVCAVDLGSESASVLRASDDLARRLGARLTLAHALPELGELARDFVDETSRVTLARRVAERLAALARQHAVEAEIAVESGPPYDVVPRLARRLGADLVVIGRGSIAGHVFGRLRANAYEIIRRSPCPVASV